MAMMRMLSKEQLDAMGNEAVRLVREYEQELLNLIAKKMGSIDVMDERQVQAAQIAITIKAKALARKYRKKIAKAAKSDLDAAFYLNAAQELQRLFKAS